jgi:hypothetical protein
LTYFQKNVNHLMKAKIKQLLFGRPGKIKIKAGIAQGLIMDLNPSNESQRILGLGEAEIASAFKRWAKQSDVLLDIGSAEGFYSLVFRKLNPTGLALLFDADARFPAIQKANFEANNFRDGYEIYTKYVADVTSTTTISVDDLLSQKGLASKKLLFKIDVDGGELLVLKGIRNVLVNGQCRLIIETHSQELEDSCMAYLNGLGYKTTIVDNAWWRVILPELRPIGHNRWFVAEKLSR